MNTELHLQSTTSLYNGVKIPWLGLGTFALKDSSPIKNAIQIGYRSIDTASIYGNEQIVGEGIRQGIETANISRAQLFVASKIWITDQGYDETLAAYEKSIQKLGVNYLDLYVIHWPVKEKYKETWRALETLYKQERVRAIGISNFQIHHIEDIMESCEIKPMVNQIEYHPLLTQKNLYSFCYKQGIQLISASPFMKGQLLDNPILQNIAAKYNKSVAQIILRWNVQNHVIPIPKSSSKERILSNANIFDFQLKQEDMELIYSLNQNHRIGPDPNNSHTFLSVYHEWKQEKITAEEAMERIKMDPIIFYKRVSELEY
ncbi:Aldo/keto reductase [Marininema mesophilum]|uniref:Aldo/keto reductase n=1 Tax=Marininema mesophilum TaxID=1048340 RepID=A0A1H2T4D3_9BACL|nr:Aldo/keto reductase [Marininema mesophilum]